MKKFLQFFILMSIVFFSCSKKRGDESEAFTNPKQFEILNLTLVDSTSNSNREEFLDTQFEYSDSIGNSLLIQNSFPKGGLKYTDPKGNNYVYSVFWTQFINKTERALDIKINFPSEDQELSSSPEIRYNLILPLSKMTEDKIQQMNYGLSDMKLILDSNFGKSQLLEQTIESNQSNMFYVIVLTSQGVEGTIRAGLKLKGEELIYRINQSELNVGEIQY